MAEHQIFRHGGLEELADGVWRVKGGLPFPLHRNMVILRLPKLEGSSICGSPSEQTQGVPIDLRGRILSDYPLKSAWSYERRP